MTKTEAARTVLLYDEARTVCVRVVEASEMRLHRAKLSVLLSTRAERTLPSTSMRRFASFTASMTLAAIELEQRSNPDTLDLLFDLVSVTQGDR